MDSYENILGVLDTDASSSGKDGEEREKKIARKLTAPKRKRIVGPVTPEEIERRRVVREAKAAKAAEARNKIIVGIDFGTTYSGIAYGTTTRSWEHVKVISNWNGGMNDNMQKVPTRIAYAAENDFEDDLWGYDVEPGITARQWFKLLLDNSTARSDFDDELLQQSTGSSLMQLPEGQTAQEVATDFLGYLYDHTMTRLEAMARKTTVEETAIRFLITTPATWSLAARQATRQAAEEAGFGQRERDDLILIDEPEAAAIAAIKGSIATFGVSQFQQNTCVMIVDMGGGTVDLITHRLIKIEPLQLEEACVGQGGKCGGTTIDRNFHELLRDRFGVAFTKLSLSKIGSNGLFMKVFEEIKRDFKGDIDKKKVYKLPLKMTKLDMDDPQMADWYDFEDDMVKLKGKDIEEMFEPVLLKTFELVNKQLNRVQKAKMPAVKTIALAGGLGASPYIQTKFKEFIRDSLGDKLGLLEPQDAWSLVVRGAVIGGLERSPVMYRRCRDHIGFCVHEKFIDKKHKPTDRYECPILGERAKNQMRWHVSRGEKISRNLKKQIECYFVIESDEFGRRQIFVHQDLYGYSRKKAPTRMNASVFKVGRITMDVAKAVKSERKRIQNENGEDPERLKFNITLELTLGADKGTLIAKAKFGKQMLGGTIIEYEANPAYKGILVTEDD